MARRQEAGRDGGSGLSTPVTLTVVLRPAHGGEPPPEGVTAATAAAPAPHPRGPRRVQEWFADHGFEVAPMVGTSFAIVAPPEHARAVLGDVPEVGELDRDRLPADVAEHVQAVVAEPPPDFGPTSW
jgi:hypothetical protein